MGERHRKAAEAMWKDPEMRQRLSNASKERWADPEWKAKTAKKAAKNLKKRYDEDQDLRARLSAKQQDIWSLPERRKRASEAAKRVLAPGSETCRKISSKAKERWQDPEYRERMSQRHKEQWQDPKFREKMLELRRTQHQRHPELAEKKSAWAKEAWASGKFSRRQFPWEPRYTKEWWEVRRQCFEHYGTSCAICGDSPKRLDVHHLVPYFLNQENSIEHLRVLCCSCHRKVERALCKLYREESELMGQLSQGKIPDMPIMIRAGEEAMQTVRKNTLLKEQRPDPATEATVSNGSTSALQDALSAS